MPNPLTVPDRSEFHAAFDHFKLVEQSKKQHPELKRTSRPTVAELLRGGAVVKQLIGHRLWPDANIVVNIDPKAHSGVLHFRHHVGEGLHYLNNQIVSFDDGSEESGITSETCILWCAHITCFRNVQLTLNDLWNKVYPDDNMSDHNLSIIIHSGSYLTESFDTASPEDIADAIEDLRTIKCDALADLIEERMTANRVAGDDSKLI